MATTVSNIPLVNTPFLDSSGRVTEVWWRFLLAIWLRTGGATGGDTESLTVADVLGLESVFSPISVTQDNDIGEMVLPPASRDSVLDMVFAPAANTDSAQAAHTVALGASPATYTATYRQAFHVAGGSVSALSVRRGPSTLPVGSSGSDIVDATYASGVGFTPGVTTALTLPVTFGAVSRLWVFFDAAYQGDDQIASLVGATLTFTSAIPVGVSNVYVKGLSISAQGVGSQLIELSPGDQVTVTYSSAPTVTILPR